MFDPNDVNPPATLDIEIDWEKVLPENEYECDKCKEPAIMECQLTGSTNLYGIYCKSHYDSLFDDVAEELSEPVDASDYFEED